MLVYLKMVLSPSDHSRAKDAINPSLGGLTAAVRAADTFARERSEGLWAAQSTFSCFVVAVTLKIWSSQAGYWTCTVTSK